MNFLSGSIGQGDLDIGLQLAKNLTTNRESNATPVHPNMVNGDSDADSGIVAIGPTRIGSASSTDTDPDVTLACVYGGAKSSSSSSSSSSNRDSTNPTPVPISIHQDKRKPIFQRVRFDDQSQSQNPQQTQQQQQQSDSLTLRKSLSLLSTPMYQSNNSTEMRQTQSTIQSQPSPTVLPKETHPLAHRRLTTPSPLTLKSTLTTSTTTTRPMERSWSTLPRNNKIGNNNNNTNINNNAKWKSTVNQKNRTNFQSTLPRKPFQETKKPDLIESHSVKLSLSSSFRSSPELPKPVKTISTTTIKGPTKDPIKLPTKGPIKKSTNSTSTNVSKSRSCSTLNGYEKDKMSTNGTNSNGSNDSSGSDEPKISKLCTIDPLESTDSMVCAFASVANVITDDCSSIVSDKVTVDKAVAAAVAAVNYVTNNQVNLVSSSTRSNQNCVSTTLINNSRSKGHPFNNSGPKNERGNGSSEQNLQRINLSGNVGQQKIEFHEMKDNCEDVDQFDENDNNNIDEEKEDDDNLDYQYEAIFPCEKTGLNCNQPESSSSVPLDPLIKSKVTIGNSTERNQSLANSNESEPSNGQRTIQSQAKNNAIAQHHHFHHSSHLQSFPTSSSSSSSSSSSNLLSHPSNYLSHNPMNQPANLHLSHLDHGNLNGQPVNPISSGIHYKSILKRSSTSSPNWPLPIHFGRDEEEQDKVKEDKVGKKSEHSTEDDDHNVDENNHHRKVELADNNERYSGEKVVPIEVNENNKSKDDEKEETKGQIEVVQKQEEEKTVPMALQINGPHLIPTLSSKLSSPPTTTTHQISSSSHQSMNRQHQQLKANNILPKMITSYSNGILSSTNTRLLNDPIEAAYLQPDQVYPLALSKSKSTSTLKSKDEEIKNHRLSTCEVEYATISRLPAKKQDSNQLIHPNHSHYHNSHSQFNSQTSTQNNMQNYLHNHPHHSTHSYSNNLISHQTSSTLTKPKFDNQIISSSIDKTLSSPVIKMTRFADDVSDGIELKGSTFVSPSTSNKWFTKRIGGLKKVLSRAFSTDKLAKESGLSNNNPTSTSSLLLTSSLTASANLKSSLVESSKRHISPSKSTPNLNCKLESIDSLQKNHSTEDLSIDLKSFVKTVKNRMSFRKGKSKSKSIEKDNSTNQSDKQDECKTKWINVNTKENCNQESNQLWGELIELKSDGSQVIELNRSQTKPFGFFLARGTVNNVKGVFVSRMRDEQTQTTLAGLLEIGDEIIAIDGLDVKSHNIAQVNQLMTIKKKIKLTVKPYINQNH